MPAKTLGPIPGFPRELGLCLAGLEDERQRLIEAVSGMTSEQIQRPAFAGSHSIGALVLHIGEGEWYWIQMVVMGHELTDEDRNRPCWDILEDLERTVARGYTADFCLSEIAKIREQTKETLSAFGDADLDRIFSINRRGELREQSLRWILHHLVDHEAGHKGQILMLKRLIQSD